MALNTETGLFLVSTAPQYEPRVNLFGAQERLILSLNDNTGTDKSEIEIGTGTIKVQNDFAPGMEYVHNHAAGFEALDRSIPDSAYVRSKVTYYNMGAVVKHDGTDDLVKLQTVINGLPDNTVMYFPRGTWVVANDTASLTLVGRRGMVFVGEPGGTVFTNSLGKGGNLGTNILFQECEDTTIRGITSKDTVLTRWAAWNDLFTFESCVGVNVYGCDMWESSNRHLHFKGYVTRVKIRDSYFARSCYNVEPLPGPNLSGSIVFTNTGLVGVKMSDVTIDGCTFENNYLIPISANNDFIETEGMEDAFSNFTVSNCNFYRSSGTAILRGFDMKFTANQVRECGLFNFLDAYDYLPDLSRYYSKTRSFFSPLPPHPSNTVLPFVGSLLVIGQSNTIEISNNTFVNCYEKQVMPDDQVSPPIVYISGLDCKGNRIFANDIQDIAVPPTTEALHIGIYGSDIANRDNSLTENYILLPAGFSNDGLIQVENGIESFAYRNVVRINPSAALYGGTIYIDIVPKSDVETDPVWTAFKPNVVYGDNASKSSAVVADTRAINKSGYYYAGGSVANRINGQDTHIMHCEINNPAASYGFQIATNIVSGSGIWYAKKVNHVWSSYKKLSENYDYTANGLNFGTIPAGNDSELTFPVPEAVVNDECYAYPVIGLNLAGMFFKAFCFTDGVVTIAAANYTSQDIDPFVIPQMRVGVRK
jgi:hypothetical protein